MQSTYFLKSKRFWGMLIVMLTAILPAVSPFFGWDVDPAVIIDLGEKGNALLTAVGGVVGLVLTVIGSMKAKGPMVVQ